MNVVVHTEHALISGHKTELRSRKTLPGMAQSPEFVAFVTRRNLAVDLTRDLLFVEERFEFGETVFVRGIAKLEEQASVPSGGTYRSTEKAQRLELVGNSSTRRDRPVADPEGPSRPRAGLTPTRASDSLQAT